MKILIVGLLFAIVGSLGQALFAMSSGPGNSTRMVRALTIRVGLSVALFALLLLSWHFGWMEPQNARH
ncbi:MAG TPA: twin transmembrane helix small protein [Povalibacter sp.]|nr:twin transmembrane helix small protein [Povalibacter sp.]